VGSSTSWNPLGLSRPLMALLYLYLYLYTYFNTNTSLHFASAKNLANVFRMKVVINSDISLNRVDLILVMET
jgi:hypothetical protein